MFENTRTKKLAILGAMAVILGLGAMSPVFAWTSNLNSTSLTPTSCGTSSGCATASVTDTALLTLTNDGAPRGSVTFTVYAAAVGATCASSGSALWSDTESVPSTGTYVDSSHTQFSITSASFSTTGHVGSFVWIVSYPGTGSGGYPGVSPKCEPMKLLTFPPPSTVPQFPLGMALLLAVAIPGLLLVRSKYTGKHSSFLSVR